MSEQPEFQAETGVDTSPYVIGPADPIPSHPQAANIATAAELVTGHHSTLEAAGAWLYATAAGVFESAEHAIEHIEDFIDKV